MQAQRVLLIDHTGQEGGGEIALLRLAEQLRDRFDVRAIVLGPGPFVERLRRAGVETIVVPLDADVASTPRDEVLGSPLRAVRALVRVVRFLPRLVRAIRESHADLVVANTLKSAVVTAIAAPLAGRRWVWHLHDRLAPDYLPPRLATLMRMLAVIGPRRIVANSSATLCTLPPRAAAKAVVAYPGLPSDAFAEPAGSTASREHAVVPSVQGAAGSGEPAVFGILGRLGRTKGQREFLEAAALVARRREGVRFVVIGSALFNDAPYERELRELPAAVGIADRVEFTGWVSDPAARLRELTALVHASPVPEPFGQVLIEAMAAGVPVIATDAGGASEIVDPQSAVGARPRGDDAAHRRTRWGQLVAPGDIAALAAAMEWTLAEPAAVLAMADAARTSVQERFTIETTGRIVAEAWAAAIGPAETVR